MPFGRPQARVSNLERWLRRSARPAPALQARRDRFARLLLANLVLEAEEVPRVLDGDELGLVAGGQVELDEMLHVRVAAIFIRGRMDREQRRLPPAQLGHGREVPRRSVSAGHDLA